MSVNKKKNVVFFHNGVTSFVAKDIAILEKHFNLRLYEFRFTTKPSVVFTYLHQLIFILKNIGKSDIFISQFSGHVSLLPSLLGKIGKVPSLIMVAGTDAACFPTINYGNFSRATTRWATKLSYRFCTHISPCHESLIEQDYTYYEGGMPKQGMHVFSPESVSVPKTVIYYGFDSTQFKRLDGVKRNERSFLTIGNLSVPSLFLRKGYDLVIEAARHFPDYTFTLVGAPEEWSLENAPPNVDLLPFLPQSELPALFSKHQFYFQLSIMEGFPNALCEAMLSECVPIGSAVSGIPYIIGDTGYVLKKRDFIELKEIIRSLPYGSELEEMGISARQRISGLFTNEKRERELVELVDRVMNKY